MKGVPTDPDSKLPWEKCVLKQIWWTGFYYAQSVVALMMLGFGYAFKEQVEPEEQMTRCLANAIVGWSGAVWVWARLCCAYCLASALSIVVGITETWEWPPLMGSLRDALSVRQMWR